MPTARKPIDETERLAALRRYEVLDTPRERAFDEVVELAMALCEAPMGLIGLIDDDRQWYKSACGLGDSKETARSDTFCSHTILEDGPTLVEDARLDARFSDHPSVLSGDVRFYAGVPIRSMDGFALGTLCVIDSKPHELPADKLHALTVLAHQVEARLELGRTVREMARLMKQREELSALVVHDLRNPLSAVQLQLALLMRTASTPDHVAIANDIGASVRSILGMTDDVLHIAKSTSGRLEPNYWPIEPSELMAAVMKSVEGHAKLRDVTIDWSAPETMKFLGDPSLLRRMIENLVENAIKYGRGPSRTGKISIRFAEAGEKIEISVADEGEGMTDEQRGRIFEPFVQIGDSADRAGFGLGLSSCRTIVEAHRGRIWAEENRPTGTVFRIELPRSRP